MPLKSFHKYPQNISLIWCSLHYVWLNRIHFWPILLKYWKIEMQLKYFLTVPTDCSFVYSVNYQLNVMFFFIYCVCSNRIHLLIYLPLWELCRHLPVYTVIKCARNEFSTVNIGITFCQYMYILRSLSFFSYSGSATILPITLSKPRLCAARAAAAMVLTLFGAKGHSSRTGPRSRKDNRYIICSVELELQWNSRWLQFQFVQLGVRSCHYRSNFTYIGVLKLKAWWIQVTCRLSMMKSKSLNFHKILVCSNNMHGLS